MRLENRVEELERMVTKLQSELTAIQKFQADKSGFIFASWRQIGLLIGLCFILFK